jgi:DNA topoisomerase-1
MQSAELDQTTVDLADASGRTRLRATGSVIAFDGFLKLYREDLDDSEADRRAGLLTGAGKGGAEEEDTRTLPPMREKDPVKRGEVSAHQHFTQPPPRYSEASLVKRMEELGIGRPSTYASILQVLQDREYVTLEKRRFHRRTEVGSSPPSSSRSSSATWTRVSPPGSKSSSMTSPAGGSPGGR